MERIGLGGFLTFNATGAVAGMNAAAASARRLAVAGFGQIGPALAGAGQAFRVFGQAAGGVLAGVGRSVQVVGGSITKLGMAAAGLSLVFGLGVKTAADFEQQMSAVRAITRASGDEFEALQAKAKHMGATTVFTATQAGEAMEGLARAGFTTAETIDALDGVMAAAAADAMPLETAARITSQVIRAMGLEAKEASRVADVLAVTSSKTNTDIIGLGEGFKFAAAQAKMMGIPLEETAAALGVISDAGIRGTLAGTSFTNMLVKLTRPTSKATKTMKEYNIEIFEMASGNLDLTKTLASVGDGLKDVQSKFRRAQVITEVFGIRGQKAVAAIDQAITSGKFGTLVEQLRNANGAAKEMAEIRLANLKGAITLAKSAMEGFFIEAAGLFLGPMQGTTKQMTESLQGIVAVLQLINAEVDEGDERWKKYGKTTIAIAKGIHQGITDVLFLMDETKKAIDALFKVFGQGSSETTQQIARLATVIGLVLALTSPLILIVGMAVTAVGGVIVAIGAGIAAIAAAGWPVIAAGIGLVVLAFVAVGAAIGGVLLGLETLKQNGVTVTEFLVTAWNSAQDAINYVMTNAVNPFVDVIRNVVTPVFVKLKYTILTQLQFVWMKWSEISTAMGQAMQRLSPIFRLVFRNLGIAVSGAATVFMNAMRFMLQAIRPVMSAVIALGKFIVEAVINNLISLVSMAIKAADALGKPDLIPPELREFAKGGEFKFTAPSVGGGGPVPTGGGPSATEIMANIGEGPSAESVMAKSAAARGAAAGPGKTDVDVKVEDSRAINVDNKLSVDGREMSVALGRTHIDVSERAGYRASPWQRRLILEHGFAPGGR